MLLAAMGENIATPGFSMGLDKPGDAGDTTGKKQIEWGWLYVTWVSN